MKHLISFLFLLLAGTSFGQITLEHSYSNDGGAFNNYPNTYAFFVNGSINYYTLQASTGDVNIYDNGHSLVNTIHLNLQAGYVIKTLFLMTDKLFNNDNNLEFIIVSYNQSLHNYSMQLFNDSGQVLYDFGNKWEARVIKNSDTVFKLMITNDDISDSYEIYSIPGTLSVQQQSVYLNKVFAYPVPANNQIRIGYKIDKPENLYIYDMYGQLVLDKIINSNNDLKIDISSLSNGTYIYKIGNNTGKFTKK